MSHTNSMPVGEPGTMILSLSPSGSPTGATQATADEPKPSHPPQDLHQDTPLTLLSLWQSLSGELCDRLSYTIYTFLQAHRASFAFSKFQGNHSAHPFKMLKCLREFYIKLLMP